jgi:hypothetical protein
MKATRIKIGDQLPLLTERDRLIREQWRINGRINVSLLEKIQIIKQIKK